MVSAGLLTPQLRARRRAAQQLFANSQRQRGNGLISPPQALLPQPRVAGYERLGCGAKRGAVVLRADERDVVEALGHRAEDGRLEGRELEAQGAVQRGDAAAGCRPLSLGNCDIWVLSTTCGGTRPQQLGRVHLRHCRTLPETGRSEHLKAAAAIRHRAALKRIHQVCHPLAHRVRCSRQQSRHWRAHQHRDGASQRLGLHTEGTAHGSSCSLTLAGDEQQAGGQCRRRRAARGLVLGPPRELLGIDGAALLRRDAARERPLLSV
mmetsp:Transcript_3804/g.9749  ORF Transcript_3804/g.9749 Transcript_3804/m.9749 type:complete len:265 (-) Transcript_3804:905-1699(-)